MSRRRYRTPAADNPTSAEITIPQFHYEFIKSYLYRVYRSDLPEDGMAIDRLMGVLDVFTYRTTPVTVSDDLAGNFIRVMDQRFAASVHYRGHSYDVVVYSEANPLNEVSYRCYIHGTDGTARAFHRSSGH